MLGLEIATIVTSNFYLKAARVFLKPIINFLKKMFDVKTKIPIFVVNKATKLPIKKGRRGVMP